MGLFKRIKENIKRQIEWSNLDVTIEEFVKKYKNGKIWNLQNNRAIGRKMKVVIEKGEERIFLVIVYKPDDKKMDELFSQTIKTLQEGYSKIVNDEKVFEKTDCRKTLH